LYDIDGDNQLSNCFNFICVVQRKDTWA